MRQSKSTLLDLVWLSTMRRRRVLIFEEDVVTSGLLKTFFNLRGYDIFVYREPLICPVYKDNVECNLTYLCADVMITEFKIGKMTGTELLSAQTVRHCKLSPLNKALITSEFNGHKRADLGQEGWMVFEKPIDFSRLSMWLDQCEKRMDLTAPLGFIRTEKRQPCNIEISFQTAPTPGIQRGVAKNCSLSGFCLIVSTRLWLHQSLTILRADKNHPSHSASVRWIKTLGNNSFETGLHLEGITE
jgi:hypothetical protein